MWTILTYWSIQRSSFIFYQCPKHLTYFCERPRLNQVLRGFDVICYRPIWRSVHALNTLHTMPITMYPAAWPVSVNYKFTFVFARVSNFRFVAILISCTRGLWNPKSASGAAADTLTGLLSAANAWAMIGVCAKFKPAWGGQWSGVKFSRFQRE